MTVVRTGRHSLVQLWATRAQLIAIVLSVLGIVLWLVAGGSGYAPGFNIGISMLVSDAVVVLILIASGRLIRRGRAGATSSKLSWVVLRLISAAIAVLVLGALCVGLAVFSLGDTDAVSVTGIAVQYGLPVVLILQVVELVGDRASR